MKIQINWKLFFLLLILSIVTVLLVVPYSLALTGKQNELTPVLLLLSLVQNLVLFAAAIFFGLILSSKVGMGAPILEGILAKKNQSEKLKSILMPSVALGVLGGILIILLSLLFQSLSAEMLEAEKSVSTWKALLASFYGGVGEEIMFRLFVVSLFVWITFKIKKTKEGLPTNFGIWLSIILTAVLFGLGHLGITGEITAITATVIIRAILLNGVVAVIYGWLYWKKGLEAAVIAHFSTDIVIHVITPLVASFFGA